MKEKKRLQKKIAKEIIPRTKQCYIQIPFVIGEMFVFPLLPPNLYVESLNLSVVEFGDEAFKEVIKVQWGHEGGVLIQ